MAPDAGAPPLAEELASPALARARLGEEAFSFLESYLTYSRATVADVESLAAVPGETPPALSSLRRAEATCSPERLRGIVAEIGWPRLNLGLEVRHCVAVGLGDSLPFVLPAAEARMLERSAGARRLSECWLAVAHGAAARSCSSPDASGPLDSVARFRSYNMAHAELLQRLLLPGALTPERVRDIVGRMDFLVAEFDALFAGREEDAGTVSGAYEELKRQILPELERARGATALPPDLTRLVLAFDDPPSCVRARSLHGLKRWLHQRGLQLGFKLMRGGGAVDRSVDLLLAASPRPPLVVRRIRYADLEPFEADNDDAGPRLPYPVAAAVEGFSRQMLYGQEKFPHLDMFCYGSEVHYFLSFWNHPALLRINYAPPLRGGMIDLQYYGVSNYEVDVHPAPALEAIRELLCRLDFAVTVDTTRVCARFDKERTLDLGQLRERAEEILALAPHLMDLDWVVGSLALDARAKRAVAEAWAERFALWGALPLAEILTRDRRGILTAVVGTPAGEREEVWSGEPPYRDRFGPAPEAERLAPLLDEVEGLGVEILSLPEAERQRPLGQLALERRVLRPLRAAIARGAVLAGRDGLRAAPGARHRIEHEAVRFATLLAEGGAALEASARLARLLPALERSLRFVTTGTVQGHEVQRARLPLRDESWGLFVLRGPRGIARLALFARGEALYLRRASDEGPWRSNAQSEAADLLGLLRRGEYLTPGDERLLDGPVERPDELRARLMVERASLRPASLPGERTLSGVVAAPGRAVGRVRFGPRGRPPADFEGAVLVTPTVAPEDSAHLWRSAGVVSTGGGALSHAGLIATEFGKPALIVPGRWTQDGFGRVELACAVLEFCEERAEVAGIDVRVRRAMREREWRLAEDDLVVLDADVGTLELLGQAPETLALHEHLRALASSALRLGAATADRELLALRGRRLRARRAGVKSLSRLLDPMLARHAVHEILLGRSPAVEAEEQDERAELLAAALGNPRIAGVAATHLEWSLDALRRRRDAATTQAVRSLRDAEAPFEILWTRARTLDLRDAFAGALRAARRVGLAMREVPEPSSVDLDGLAVRRLRVLRERLVGELDERAERPHDPRLGHLLRRIERLDELLGTPAPGTERRRALAARLAAEDDEERRRLSDRRVLGSNETGLATSALAGWKAANLAEVARLGGPSLVPEWFVITDRAFRDALELPVDRIAPGPEIVPPDARTLGDAIGAILARDDETDGGKSSRIRALWERLCLPRALEGEIVERYHGLGPETAPDVDVPPGPPFVAVRSSGIEEDAEAAAHAGEFDTFLFVRGEDELITHVKRAWAGLWTERAIHNRSAFGVPASQTGGGVVVQRIVRSRAAGVLQTVNVARGEPRDLVINVGLGLGEGIVKGSVEVDVFTVAKDQDLERGKPRFHCVVGEKRQKAVFNRAVRRGTVLVETLQHERLRPALEYVELCELATVAARLERAYGHPLNIEFGIEGERLWILQARPVATWSALLRETLDHRPLAGREDGR